MKVRKVILVTIILLLILSSSFAMPVTTSMEVPAQVTLLAPAHGAGGISTAPVLSWNPVARATVYEIVIYRFESGIPIDILRQTTISTSLLVKRPFLLGPERRDLREETTYWWRVRGNNIIGNGPWSTERSFTTKRRNVWTPTYIEMAISLISGTNHDLKQHRARWDQEAVDWFQREQSWWIWPIRKELWWEHELRASNLGVNFWASVVSSTFSSELPDRNFEFQTDEFSFRSDSPEQIVADGRSYYSEIRFNRASGRPSSFIVQVESELTDWLVTQAWIDTVSPGVFLPGVHSWNVQ